MPSRKTLLVRLIFLLWMDFRSVQSVSEKLWRSSKQRQLEVSEMAGVAG
jgi:hypothetical protein